MKRILILALLLMLVIGVFPTFAQGDNELTQTYTSEDGTLSFNYPERWSVNVDEEGYITLSNVKDYDSEQIFEPLPSGQVSIDVVGGGLDRLSKDGEILLPANASAEFIAGYMSGLYRPLIFYVVAFSEQSAASISFESIESVEIGDETASLVQMDVEDMLSVLIIAFPTTEDSVKMVIVNSAYGEMDDYRDLSIAVADSIEVTP